jgi:hypothetical protein
MEKLPEKHRLIFTKQDGKYLLAYFLGWLVCILVFAFVFWR